MYQRLLGSANLFTHLAALDTDHAAAVQRLGCPSCGGRLDSARYPRKPRGLPAEAEDLGSRRASFCCAACRRRCKPFSVLFLGRRVYVGAVMVIVGLLRQPTRRVGLDWIARHVGADRRTVRRWLEWWRDEFPETDLYRILVADLTSSPSRRGLPATLVERYVGEPFDRLVALLRHLRPLTSGSAGRGF